MSHHVIRLGQWVDLSPDQPPQYVCRNCRGVVSLGNTGKAISQPDGSWLYEHYGKCVPDVPAKKSRKRNHVKRGAKK